MRAIWLTNTTEGSFRAMHAKDAYGQPLEFAPKGHAPVNAESFHDAWIRALLSRGTLRTDFAYAASRAPGVTAGELAIEAGSNLLELGFSQRDVHKMLGVVPSVIALEAPQVPQPPAPPPAPIEPVAPPPEPEASDETHATPAIDVVGEPLEPAEALFAPPVEETVETTSTSTRRRKR